MGSPAAVKRYLKHFPSNMTELYTYFMHIFYKLFAFPKRTAPKRTKRCTEMLMARRPYIRPLEQGARTNADAGARLHQARVPLHRVALLWSPRCLQRAAGARTLVPVRFFSFLQKKSTFRYDSEFIISTV